MKLPFISQKEHKQILDNLRISQNKQISKIEEEHQKQIEDLKKEINELLPKLFKVTLQKRDDYNYGKYRLCLDLDDNWVREAFIHGNSDYWIQHLSEIVKRKVYSELKTINFERFK